MAILSTCLARIVINHGHRVRQSVTRPFVHAKSIPDCLTPTIQNAGNDYDASMTAVHALKCLTETWQMEDGTIAVIGNP
jgi:hypothetical protein